MPRGTMLCRHSRRDFVGIAAVLAGIWGTRPGGVCPAIYHDLKVTSVMELNLR